MAIPDEVRQWRKAERARLLEARMAVPEVQRRQWNQTITRQLLEDFPMLKSMVIGLYWPFKGEFDPRIAILRWRERGARAALPVVIEKGTPLQFREWWAGVKTTKGVFDLPVPEGTPVLVPEALLIPPIGFDVGGYRLGYGGGYFDRTLASLKPQPLKIGVAFELSRIPSIQPQPHDIPMDFIVTQAGVHHVGEDGLQLITDTSRVRRIAESILRERRGPLCATG
jgi:5-formyltetrahydrofolate cyclo-ligase